MRVSLKWLKDYLDLTLPTSELALKLTLAGTEVSNIETSGGWENVFVARLVQVDPHPNADRLRLATVEVEPGVRETVVCGAPNLTVGDNVVFARVGARLRDGHSRQAMTLKAALIRGVESRGMVCSPRELGLSDEHEGILVLAADAAPGTPLDDYMGDVIFDLEVTPNRPDLLSMRGVAHEVAALTAARVEESSFRYVELGEPIDGQMSVSILDAGLCPRYSAALIKGVKIGESPTWIKAKLAASGVRSINNVVDITNLVMLEYGQPLHAFDYDRLEGHQIIVRRAADGENITTLDEIERRLSPDTLVIADAGGAVAIAGVMGGATSEVTAETTDILLESASFHPASIHRTAARLKMGSEASRRFERGISSELTVYALHRAAGLMVEVCGGTAASGIIDAYPGRSAACPIAVSTVEIKRILGVDIGIERAAAILTSLGCRVDRPGTDEMLVTAPYWRSDIRIPADVIEEIARIMGYDAIPFRRLGREIPEYMPATLFTLKNRLRQILCGYGADEVMSASITSREQLRQGLNAPLEVEPLRIDNPMAADQECLRTSLRGSLLGCLAFNLKRPQGNVFIYEIGHTYLNRPQELPAEPEMLCAVMSSAAADKVWLARPQALDYYDAKGIVQGLMRYLQTDVEFQAGNDAGLMPGHQALIQTGGEPIGVLGEIHAAVAEAFELPPGVFLCEINVTALAGHLSPSNRYHVLPRFPVAERDLALVVDAAVLHEQVIDIIKVFPLIRKATLFDVYAGKQVAGGQKSLAYNLTFQSADHTLKDTEVDAVMAALLKRLSDELGARLRA